MVGSFDSDDCFAEELVTHSSGAFAAVMNARVGHIAHIFRPSPSRDFAEQFWDAVLNENYTELGRVNQDSKEDNLWNINASDVRYCYYELTLFGDPAQKFRFGNRCPWLNLESPNGQIAANTFSNVTVSCNATGMRKGTYRAQIILSCNDETQPRVTIPVTMLVQDRPADLTVNHISVNNQLVLGTQFELEYSVANHGDLVAGDSFTGFYLSQDPILDTNDFAFNDLVATPPLNAGQAYTNTITLTLPTVDNWPEGNAYILVQADDTCAIAEHSEINNITASESIMMTHMSITNLRVALARPDSSIATCQDVEFEAWVEFEGGEHNNVSDLAQWTSDNPNVLAFSSSNSPRAVAGQVGTAHITATYHSLSSTPMTVTVLGSIISNAVIEPAYMNVHVGDAPTLTVIGHDYCGTVTNLNALDWISSDEQIVSISTGNVPYAISAGTVELRAIYFDGNEEQTSAPATVNVLSRFSGIVTDHSGIISNAQVTINGIQNSIITTDEQGIYQSDWLPAGTYRVSASHPLYVGSTKATVELGAVQTGINIELIKKHMEVTPLHITNMMVEAGMVSNETITIHNDDDALLSFEIRHHDSDLPLAYTNICTLDGDGYLIDGDILDMDLDGDMDIITLNTWEGLVVYENIDNTGTNWREHSLNDP